MGRLRTLLRLWRNKILYFLRQKLKNREPGIRQGVRVCGHCRRLVKIQEPHCPYCGMPFEDHLAAPAAIQTLPTEKVHKGNPASWLFGVTVVVYALAVLLSNRIESYDLITHWWTPEPEILGALGANQADHTLLQGQFWRLGTYLFMHANPIHIFFCLMFTAYLGTMLFKALGLRRFWLAVMICGLGGGIFSVHSVFLGQPPFHSSGLTNVLFGFLAIQYVLFRKQQNEYLSNRCQSLLLWGHLFFIGVSLTGITTVDHLGHLGGMVSGLLLALWFQSESGQRWGATVEPGLIACGLFFWGYGLARVLENFPW